MLVGFFCALACALPVMVSGDTIVRYGSPVARYVDDTTPGECQVVAQDREQGWTVVAGLSPSHGWDGTPTCDGALGAQEWYPFDCRYPPGAWGRMPKARAYILQDRFAWPGCRPPTVRQRARLFRQALRFHPILILWY